MKPKEKKYMEVCYLINGYVTQTSTCSVKKQKNLIRLMYMSMNQTYIIYTYVYT